MADKAAKTLTIEDNGIGMTRKELQTNLGRIAQSGTKKFTEALGSGADATNLIGQFGVGFYSAFLVADTVSVVTKSMEGGEQLRWESKAADKYTISADDSEPIEGSGTRLILTLKDEADKYADDFTLRDMLRSTPSSSRSPSSCGPRRPSTNRCPTPTPRRRRARSRR